jgi:hypothetical protein
MNGNSHSIKSVETIRKVGTHNVQNIVFPSLATDGRCKPRLGFKPTISGLVLLHKNTSVEWI